jgi:hypothetical protein
LPLTAAITLLLPLLPGMIGVVASPAGASAAAAPIGGVGPLTNSALPGEASWKGMSVTGPARQAA